MANQTSSVDTTVRISFCILQGVVLGISYPLITWLYPNLFEMYPYWVFLLVIPIIAYISSLGINTLLQYIQCQKVNMGQVAAASAIPPVFAAGFAILVRWFPFLLKPIEELSSPESFISKDLWGYLFYLFWAGMYGQAVASGLLSSC